MDSHGKVTGCMLHPHCGCLHDCTFTVHDRRGCAGWMVVMLGVCALAAFGVVGLIAHLMAG